MKTEWFKVDDTKSEHHAKRICEKASRAHTHMQETNLYMCIKWKNIRKTHTQQTFFTIETTEMRKFPSLHYCTLF